MTTPTGNGDCAGDRRLTVAHLITVDSSLRYLLITVDSSLRYLLYPQLTTARDLGAPAWVSVSRDSTPTGWWLR